MLAALSSIPWVGILVTAVKDIKADDDADRQNYLLKLWVEQHQRKLMELGQMFQEVQSRFENFGNEIDARIGSDAYFALVRKAFRVWDQSDTEEKRRMVGNIVINAGSTRACADDVIRLFIDWTELYNEVHFAVVREIFHNPGSSRFEIWSSIYGELPREDSEEADLFKFIIRDLSTGGVIRQERGVNSLGQFVRKKPIRKRGTPTGSHPSMIDRAALIHSLGRQTATCARVCSQVAINALLIICRDDKPTYQDRPAFKGCTCDLAYENHEPASAHCLIQRCK